MMTEPERNYDYLIVGCGIVGCAVARELCLRDEVTVGIVEKEFDPVAEASSGNTGHIGTFFHYTDAREGIYSTHSVLLSLKGKIPYNNTTNNRIFSHFGAQVAE